MNLENIKEGSIIIAPAYMHSFIRQSLLNNKNAIPNVRITTLSTYLKDGTNKKDESIYKYYQVLNNLKHHLIYNKESVNSLSFIMEIKAFIEDMKYYNIPLTSLLETNRFQKENKDIITKVYDIETNADIILRQIQKLKATPFLKNVYILDDFASLLDEKLYRFLLDKGAKRIHNDNSLQSKVWYSALNPRQEVESVAQYIIQNNLKAEEIHISTLDSIYLPYIQQIFNRYHIPYYVLNETVNGDILQRFLAIVSYYLNPNLKNLENLFQTHAFKHIYANAFVEYVHLHKKDIHESFHIMDNLSISDDILSRQEIDKLRDLEEKAKMVQKDVLPKLDAILSHEDLFAFLVAVDTYICETHDFVSKDDRSQLLSIREELKKAKDYLHTHKDLEFLVSILSSKRFSLSMNEKGACVSDFKHSIYKKYHFVLGCTQNNFPAFETKSGIFDENYYAKLTYPSLEERYEYHMRLTKRLLSNSKHLICFVNMSTIDGKACETSLEMEDFVGEKPSRYPLEEVYQEYIRSYEIDKEDAKALFIKNEREIHGSISSLEKYMKCPYSYFLKYGLKIKEPIDYSFNLAKCGTLIHYVFETLINENQKDYIYATEGKIEIILDKKIAEIIQVYPKEKDTLEHLKKRLIKAIISNLAILKDHEEHSSLTPSECEYQFDYTFPINDSYEIVLHGIIDRIDTNKDFLRVIDYKSSAHSLKEERVFSAQQLQLITYLLIAQDKLQKRPLGAFYYSMALPSIKMIAGKLKKRPLMYINYTEEDYYASFLKENRLHGWVCDMDYIEAMDDNGSHIVGVSNSKSSGISARTIYHYDTLKQYMNEIYRIVGNKILEGEIECEASDSACLYCPYARICMKANKTYDKDEIINVTSSLYLKGGRKDADME